MATHPPARPRVRFAQLATRPQLLVLAAMAALLGACMAPPADLALPSGVAGGERVPGDMLLRMGQNANEAGDPGAAVAFFRQAVQQAPTRAEAHADLGQALLSVGQPLEAGEAFGRAVELDPASVTAHRGLARALVEMGQAEPAVVEYRATLALAPGDVATLNGLGVALDLAGRHDEAAATYRDGLARAPHNRSVRSNLGLSLALAGDAKAGVAMLQQLAAEPGASARTRQNLALAYALDGDLAAAERMARIDLDEAQARNNVLYFMSLASSSGDPVATRPLRPRAGAAVEAAPSQGARYAALDFDAVPLKQGSAPARNWYVNLGRFDTAAEAETRWLAITHGRETLPGGATRLAAAAGKQQPLLAGPFADRPGAERFCAGVDTSDGAVCSPERL